MPKLIENLPDHLYWLTEKVEGLVRPAAFMVEQRGVIMNKGKRYDTQAALGSSHTGRFDVPSDAPWAGEAPGWNRQHLQDGESAFLQLILEDIPAVVREQYPALPAVGVIWVTVDASSYEAKVRFDPRPSSQIPWLPRSLDDRALVPAVMGFVIKDTMTYCTPATLPEIADDFHGGVGMACDFDAWWDRHYGGRAPSDIQIGGWIHPIQGDADEVRKTVFLEVRDCGFGDCGAVYVHHSAEKGFFAHMHTH